MLFFQSLVIALCFANQAWRLLQLFFQIGTALHAVSFLAQQRQGFLQCLFDGRLFGFWQLAIGQFVQAALYVFAARWLGGV